MSWQLGAFAVLAVGLVGGFLWYERTRPDARLVALVGTLAALGALGRIAFAPVPNVKPTTDIVLIAGYALGGAPGYVVGAVAALTSNFFFGQGPWTPWQMAGWGAIGVFGAILATLTRGRIGRRSLAVVCFPLGFAFTALQDFGDWVTYSDHSLSQLGVYVGQGLGFDLIHALGCVGFALLFGPALLGSLRRFRTRLEVRWLPLVPGNELARVAASDGPPGSRYGPLACVLVAVAVAGAAVALAVRPTHAAAATVRTPVGYLLSAENRDGGFGQAPRQPSSSMFTGWAMLALAASGDARDLSMRKSGKTAIAYLTRTASHATADPGSIERTILAAVCAGANPRDLAGDDLVADLERRIERDGSVSQQTNLTAFAVLALRAARAPVPAVSITWLARQQDNDGGFNFDTRGAISDVDDTGAVLEALAHTDVKKAEIDRAIAYIRGQQNRDGGFPGQPGAPSNAQSTAFAVQGLIAAGVYPASLHRHGARSPLEYLRSLIAPSGAVAYAKGNDQTPVWVTAQAQLALAGKALPLSAPPASARPRQRPHRRLDVSRVRARNPAGSVRAEARRAPAGGLVLLIRAIAGLVRIALSLLRVS